MKVIQRTQVPLSVPGPSRGQSLTLRELVADLTKLLPLVPETAHVVLGDDYNFADEDAEPLNADTLEIVWVEEID